MNAQNTELAPRIIASGMGTYRHLVELPNGELACVCRFMFTDAILSGLTPWSYEDRWCFKKGDFADRALDEWITNFDTQSEPNGWHRHPSTGRRRDENGNEEIYF